MLPLANSFFILDVPTLSRLLKEALSFLQTSLVCPLGWDNSSCIIFMHFLSGGPGGVA